MKKIIVLLLLCVFLFLSCDTDATPVQTNATTQTSTTTEYTTSRPTISQSKAESEARKYVSSHQNQLTSSAKVSNIKYLEIASVSSRGSGIGYSVTLKGNFFGYDEYGKLKGTYTFSWILSVSPSNTSSGVSIYSQNLSVSRT